MSWVNWVVEGVGAYMQAEDAKDRASIEERRATAQKVSNEAQAVLAENNAQLAEWQAADAIYRGMIAQRNVRQRTRALQADQQVAAVGAGVAVGSGSVLALMEDASTQGAIEGATAGHNADREAWAYRMQALDSRNRAEILRKADIATGVSPESAFTSSLIAGAANIYRNEQKSN